MKSFKIKNKDNKISHGRRNSISLKKKKMSYYTNQNDML